MFTLISKLLILFLYLVQLIIYLFHNF